MGYKGLFEKKGLSPGSLVYVGEQKTSPAKVSAISYDAGDVEEWAEISPEQAVALEKKDGVVWIDISGIHDVAVVEKIGNAYGLHALTLEDILNTGHRPKIDDYGDYLFFVLKMVYNDIDDGSLQIEHICLVLGSGFIISFQEVAGDVFDPVRRRIRTGKGKIRKSGADYLAYALLDMIVDHYYVVLDEMGEEIEALQEMVLSKPDSSVLARIYDCKHRYLMVRKSIWPLREILSAVLRESFDLIHEDVRFYLRDVYDHVIQVADTIETYRDMLSGLLDIYMSSVSHKMNEVMKVLTVIATLFIPLTFFAGVYGMNFHYMPELEWRFAYPAFWAAAILLFVVMLILFKRKKWL
jgi:magnesium transporter